jgi:hypothetical protein
MNSSGREILTLVDFPSIDECFKLSSVECEQAVGNRGGINGEVTPADWPFAAFNRAEQIPDSQQTDIATKMSQQTKNK